VKNPAAHHAISAKFPKKIDNKGKTLVVQYEVKPQSKLIIMTTLNIQSTKLQFARLPCLWRCLPQAPSRKQEASCRGVLQCDSLCHHVRPRQVRRYEQGMC
jgi:hypothetical protein